MRKDYQNREGEYEKSYGGSSYNKDERSHFAGRKEEAAPPKARKEEPAPGKDAGSVSEETQDQQTAQKMKRAKTQKKLSNKLLKKCPKIEPRKLKCINTKKIYLKNLRK